MYEIKNETIINAYKPFDIVTNKNGDVGFIKEVNVNSSQSNPEAQIGYSVNWIVGNETKSAWFDHSELTFHCNLFVKISESTCHSFGNNKCSVKRLFNNFNLKDL